MPRLPTPDHSAPDQSASRLRLFLAVDPGEVVQQALQRSVTRLQALDAGGPLRWTRPQGRHLTLRFLGSTPAERFPAVSDACAAALAGVRPFDARLGGLGGFPTLQRARVLWVGVSGGERALAALADAFGPPLDALGFARDERPFAAHLTLARSRRPRDCGPLSDAYGCPDLPFRVDRVTLYRSETHPDGARYTPLTRFPLG